MTRTETALVAAVAGIAVFVGVQAVRVRHHAAPPPPDEPPPAAVIASPATPGRSAHDVQLELRASALREPVRDDAAVRRALQLGEGSSWIDDLLRDGDSTLARWPDRSTRPITVWVQPSDAVAGGRAEYAGYVRDAFGAWELVGLPLRFAFTDDSVGAQVRVSWADRLNVEERIGDTKRIHDQHWWVLDGEITLATHTVAGRLLEPRTIRTAALHEVGHVLGLPHTQDTTSIMAARAYGVTALSPRDLATVRLLYSLPPGRVR